MSRKKIEPSGEFLLESVIQEMADSKRLEVQIAFLRERGVPFTLSRLGRPLVKVAVYEGRDNPTHARPAWKPRILEAA